MILSQTLQAAEETLRIVTLPAFPAVPKPPCKGTAPKPPTRLWNESDDRLLVELVSDSMSKWSEIALFFPGKHISTIKRRWESTLDPKIKKTPWTLEEDTVILTILAQKGPLWKEIAQALPGRPAEMVKNRYYGHIKRLQDVKRRKEAEKLRLNPIEDWENLLVQPEKGYLSAQEALSEDSHAQPNLLLNKPRRIFI